MTEFTIHNLFGGAIHAAIPKQFIDVSEIREVPDNQEVFADNETEESIIVELLELDSSITNADCASCNGNNSAHFKQIAEDNESPNTQIVNLVALTSHDIPNMPISRHDWLPTGWTTTSSQVPRDFRNFLNTVDIFLAVIRLPQVTTDILITVNVPVLIGSTSSSRQMVNDNTMESSSNADSATPLQTGDIQLGEHHVRSLLSSFDIKDWGLFQ
ncbi:hypothetical protein BDF22DRAFT_654081 [Syncephalis plumigaleata]|nr:hypothetical protein BDF22DRAFT_654081 [Syncephalis plumigaleata]